MKANDQIQILLDKRGGSTRGNDYYVTISLQKENILDNYVSVDVDPRKYKIERQEVNPFFIEYGFFDTVSGVNGNTKGIKAWVDIIKRVNIGNSKALYDFTLRFLNESILAKARLLDINITPEVTKEDEDLKFFINIMKEIRKDSIIDKVESIDRIISRRSAMESSGTTVTNPEITGITTIEQIELEAQAIDNIDNSGSTQTTG